MSKMKIEWHKRCLQNSVICTDRLYEEISLARQKCLRQRDNIRYDSSAKIENIQQILF